MGRSEEEAPLCACGCGEAVSGSPNKNGKWRLCRYGHEKRMYDMRGPDCACGCGEPVSWARGEGWHMYVHGHHIRVKNPNTGEHMRGDKNVMNRPEVLAKCSGENHWRHRPEMAKRAEEVRVQQVNRMTGPSNPVWNGGGRVRPDGYVEVRKGGKYVLAHRLVLEEEMGRSLGVDEVVHHINEERTDNRPENLVVTKQGVHAAHHNKSRRKYPVLAPKDAPLCACGCGEFVRQVPGTPRWGKYVVGHMPQRLYPVLDPKDAPLCACGCGQKVGQSRGTWSRYRQGHWLRHKAALQTVKKHSEE